MLVLVHNSEARPYHYQALGIGHGAGGVYDGYVEMKKCEQIWTRLEGISFFYYQKGL